MAESQKEDELKNRVAIANNKLQNFTGQKSIDAKERLNLVKTRVESSACNLGDISRMLSEVEAEIHAMETAEVRGYDLGWLDEAENVEKAHFSSFVKDYPTLKKELEGNFAEDLELRKTILKRLDKYGEQCELLDPHLSEIVGLVMAPVMKALKENTFTDEDLLNPDYPINASFDIFHKIICIRGHKTIVRIMPHEVHDLEPVLALLCRYPKDAGRWTTRYGLLHWLSIIILIPFNLETVDSESSVQGGIVNRILNECKCYMGTIQRTSDASQFLLSKLFSRPDVQKEHLSDFFDYCREQIENQRAGSIVDYYKRGKKKIKKNWQHNHKLTNTLKTLAAIYKTAPRELLQEMSPKFEDVIEEIAEENFSTVGHACCKLLQRMALIYLKPVVAKWRYRKGRIMVLQGKVEDAEEGDDDEEEDSDFEVPEKIEDILALLLDNLKAQDTVVRWSSAKGIGRITMRVPLDFADEIVHNVVEMMSPNESDYAWHGASLALAELARRGLLLPERLKTVVPLLNKAMQFDRFVGNYSKGAHVRDASCYVAWAFARAYEPEVMKPYVPDIARGLLSMTVFDREGHCRRAASAAFQENVGRQRNFPHGIDIVTTADYFAVGMRNRAFLEISKFIAQYDEYQQFLINHLINVKLHHWDKEIRELSANTLYNMTDLNPKYMMEVAIPILIPKCQASIAVERHGSLLGIARILMRLADLKVPLSEFLQKKVRNIVPKIERDGLYRGKGGVYVRQGALLLIEAFSHSKIECSDEAIWRHVKTINDGLRYAQEDVQDFAVPALRVFAAAYFPEPTPKLSKMIEQWCNEMAKEQMASVCRGYGRGLGTLPKPVILNQLKLIVDTLIKRSRQAAEKEKLDYISRYKCCEALAEIVEKFEVKDYDYTWDPIEDAPKEEEEEEDDDEMPDELRQFLIETGQLQEKKPTLAVEPFIFHCDRDKPGSNLLYDRIFSCFISRYIDYETDRRGDVGSFVRQHVLRATITVIKKLYAVGNRDDGSPWIRPIYMEQYVAQLLKQSLEPLSRLRMECCKLFQQIHEIQDKDFYPHQERLMSSLNCLDMERAFRDEALVFRQFLFTWRTEEYRDFVFAAFVKTLQTVKREKKGELLEHFDSIVQTIEKEEGPKAKFQFLETLCRAFISTLQQRRINGKKSFWMNMMRSFGLLMDRDLFADLVCEEEEVITEIWRFIVRKIRNYGDDIRFSLATGQITLQMVRFPNIRNEVFEILLGRLVSKYPRIRMLTGENLYTNLLTWGDEFLAEETNEQVQALLLMPDWGEDIDETLIDVQHQLVDLLNVPQSLKYQEESEV